MLVQDQVKYDWKAHKSDSVMSSNVSQVSNPSVVNALRYWDRPSRSSVCLNSVMNVVVCRYAMLGIWKVAACLKAIYLSSIWIFRGSVRRREQSV